MSQNIGGHRPTKRARRSAFPRSSSPMVFARTQSTMQSRTDDSDAAWKCQPRRPDLTMSRMPIAAA